MTTEGQFAKGWGTGVGSTKSGTQAGWKLIKDDPDPRKRVWQLYQNGKPVPGKTKTGSLTIGGNLAEWGKGGVKNVSNFAQAFDIRDRVADEGKPSPSNINEYFNSILQERWDNAVTEDEKSSVKDLLAAFNLEEQKGIITEETGAGTTSVIPESFSEYRRRNRTEDETTAGGKVQETIQSGQPLEENQYQTWNTDMDVDEGVVGTVGDEAWTADQQPNLRSAKDYEKSVNEGKWNEMSKWDRKQAEIFARGNPRQEMKIRRAKSTFDDDLFSKNT